MLNKEFEYFWGIGPGYLENEQIVSALESLRKAEQKIKSLISEFEEELLDRLREEKSVEDRLGINTDIVKRRKQ